MKSQDFTEIAKRYRETSLVQNSAADILIALLDVKKGERILDMGCGTGNITKRLFDLSGGSVTGIDPSPGMIEESRKHYGGDMNFRVGDAEGISSENEFDIIFCNSSFQWFSDQDTALGNFHRALRPGGRVGIQAPARQEYCPGFIRAVGAVREHPVLGKTFSRFESPWFFLETAGDYTALFERRGFTVPFAEIQTLSSSHSPDEAFNVFSSGAAAGYLNRACYGCEIDDNYISGFQDTVRESFRRQAGPDGKVDLVFHRIFLVAVKTGTHDAQQGADGLRLQEQP